MYSDFGERLRFLRETAELTQQQLANELKVGRSTISLYEKGERIPDIKFLEDVVCFFDVCPDYLLGGVEDPFYGTTDSIEPLFSPLAKGLLMEYDFLISCLLEHESFEKFAKCLMKYISTAYYGDERFNLYFSPYGIKPDEYLNNYLCKIFSEIISDIRERYLHDEDSLYPYGEKSNNTIDDMICFYERKLLEAAIGKKDTTSLSKTILTLEAIKDKEQSPDTPCKEDIGTIARQTLRKKLQRKEDSLNANHNPADK